MSYSHFSVVFAQPVTHINIIIQYVLFRDNLVVKFWFC